MPYIYKGKKKKKFFSQFVLVFIIVFVLLIVSVSFFFINRNYNNIKKKNKLTYLYKKLFNEKNYLELIQNMDNELKKNPISQEFLIYRGFSYFLLAEEEIDIYKRKTFFIQSLFDLRKAIAIDTTRKNIGNVFFCIGKIYYYLGEDYYRLALKYLNKSLDVGNERKDLYYTIGLLYSHTGNFKKAVEIFYKAYELEHSELVLIAIANCYYLSGEYQQSKEVLYKVLDKSANQKIIEKSNFMLGEIFYKEKNYKDSLIYFNKVVEKNENNAGAYFYRGEIYNLNNNQIKARAEWRKTLELDPSHVKALKRIY